MFVMFFIIILMVEFKDILTRFLGSNDYMFSEKTLLFLLMGFLFNSLSSISGIGISLSLKSYLNIIPALLSLFSIVIFLHFLTPKFSLYGVSFSFLLSSLIKLFFKSFLSNWSYKDIKIFWFKPLIILIAGSSLFYFLITKELSVFLHYFIEVFILLILFVSLIPYKSFKSFLANFKL